MPSPLNNHLGALQHPAGGEHGIGGNIYIDMNPFKSYGFRSVIFLHTQMIRVHILLKTALKAIVCLMSSLLRNLESE